MAFFATDFLSNMTSWQVMTFSALVASAVLMVLTMWGRVL
jgi:hypothetical protein